MAELGLVAVEGDELVGEKGVGVVVEGEAVEVPSLETLAEIGAQRRVLRRALRVQAVEQGPQFRFDHVHPFPPLGCVSTFRKN
jgi:hypothetical protein